MSGGSFDYLYSQDLVTRRETVAEMAKCLREEGHEDAAIATEKVLSLFDDVEAAQAHLYDVWHAAEWMRSGDTGEDDLRASVERWRAKKPLELRTETVARLEPPPVEESYTVPTFGGDPTRTAEPTR